MTLILKTCEVCPAKPIFFISWRSVAGRRSASEPSCLRIQRASKETDWTGLAGMARDLYRGDGRTTSYHCGRRHTVYSQESMTPAPESKTEDKLETIGLLMP